MIKRYINIYYYYMCVCVYDYMCVYVVIFVCFFQFWTISFLGQIFEFMYVHESLSVPENSYSTHSGIS